jgi:hypothetical protein
MALEAIRDVTNQLLLPREDRATLYQAIRVLEERRDHHHYQLERLANYG